MFEILGALLLTALLSEEGSTKARATEAMRGILNLGTLNLDTGRLEVNILFVVADPFVGPVANWLGDFTGSSGFPRELDVTKESLIRDYGFTAEVVGLFKDRRPTGKELTWTAVTIGLNILPDVRWHLDRQGVRSWVEAIASYAFEEYRGDLAVIGWSGAAGSREPGLGMPSEMAELLGLVHPVEIVAPRIGPEQEHMTDQLALDGPDSPLAFLFKDRWDKAVAAGPGQ